MWESKLGKWESMQERWENMPVKWVNRLVRWENMLDLLEHIQRRDLENNQDSEHCILLVVNILVAPLPPRQPNNWVMPTLPNNHMRLQGKHL